MLCQETHIPAEILIWTHHPSFFTRKRPRNSSSSVRLRARQCNAGLPLSTGKASHVRPGWLLASCPRGRESRQLLSLPHRPGCSDFRLPPLQPTQSRRCACVPILWPHQGDWRRFSCVTKTLVRPEGQTDGGGKAQVQSSWLPSSCHC